MKDWRKDIFDIVETESNALISRIYDWLMLVLIVISLVPIAFREQTSLFEWFDKVSVSFFILDYLLRWFTADFKMPNRKKWQAFILYPITPCAQRSVRQRFIHQHGSQPLDNQPQDRKTLRYEVEETLILFSSRDVKHEIRKRRAAVLVSFTLSHTTISSE